jgi:hypothetical protein
MNRCNSNHNDEKCDASLSTRMKLETTMWVQRHNYKLIKDANIDTRYALGNKGSQKEMHMQHIISQGL